MDSLQRKAPRLDTGCIAHISILIHSVTYHAYMYIVPTDKSFNRGITEGTLLKNGQYHCGKVELLRGLRNPTYSPDDVVNNSEK